MWWGGGVGGQDGSNGHLDSQDWKVSIRIGAVPTSSGKLFQSTMVFGTCGHIVTYTRSTSSKTTALYFVSDKLTCARTIRQSASSVTQPKLC